MASAPASSLHRLLETRFSQLSAEMEVLFSETRERARGEVTEQLNQAVRRLRLCEDGEELAATAVDAASSFSGAAAWFRIEGGTAKGERIRGVTEEAAERFLSLEVPLEAAAAFQGAVETRDPVAAATVRAEVGQGVVDLLMHTSDGRVSIYPILAGDRVRAVLYVWGVVSGAAVELISQVAGAVWSGMPGPAPVAAPSELVQLTALAAPPEVPAPAAPKSAWEELPADEQRVHLRAQRFARVQIAELRLHDPDTVQTGRTRRNLYDALRKPIDAARAEFHQNFFQLCPSMVDYLHLELVHTLAQDDAELLGKGYPGPLA